MTGNPIRLESLGRNGPFVGGDGVVASKVLRILCLT